MLKITICLLALAAGAWGASIGGQVVSSTTEKREIVPLLRFETEKNPDGSFHFEYEGGDQSYRQEQGQLQNAGTEDEALEVSGSYRYIDAEGNTVEVHYTAGRNGFVPIGTIIPKEITAVAQAAADLPNISEEEELRLKHRKARSQEAVVEKESVLEKESAVEKKAVVEKDQVPAESKIVPVVVEKEAVSEKKSVVEKEAVAEKKDQLPADSQVVPVQVVLDAQPKSKPEAEPKKAETKTA
ncbi:GL17720 [Drosophila persimilis]|uniref:GL17720 n=1 Tax=Drosophila persimilis TaxID=7234 RepID=B4GII0_DROPE|nr:GL17720 [Drosophila persimilis]